MGAVSSQFITPPGSPNVVRIAQNSVNFETENQQWTATHRRETLSRLHAPVRGFWSRAFEWTFPTCDTTENAKSNARKKSTVNSDGKMPPGVTAKSGAAKSGLHTEGSRKNSRLETCYSQTRLSWCQNSGMPAASFAWDSPTGRPFPLHSGRTGRRTKQFPFCCSNLH